MGNLAGMARMARQLPRKRTTVKSDSMDSTSANASQSTRALLCSGGLDSAILLGEMLAQPGLVQPLYVRQGLFWEAVELTYLRRFLKAVRKPSLQRLQILQGPVRDLYGAHWSLTGMGVPDASTPDEAVFLPGRNVLLLSKAILWCHLHGAASVALGSLETNPFPDATPAFFHALEQVVNQAVGGTVRIYRPYAQVKKVEVMMRGRDLPLEHTFSCIRPVEGLHCGTCNKCAERRHAFADAGLVDPTLYFCLDADC